jgi:hypothetical protein
MHHRTAADRSKDRSWRSRVSQIRDARLLVIGTYRDGDLGAGEASAVLGRDFALDRAGVVTTLDRAGCSR